MSNRLINKARVRQLALDYAKKTRAHEWTRVSQEFLDRIEAQTAEAIRREINRAPSVGSTLK
jgi:hypothetical protein